MNIRRTQDRDCSIGNNSSTQAEGKHDFTVHRTKTPKLGIHMKTRTTRNGGKRNNNALPAAVQQHQKLQLLSVPKLVQIQSSACSDNGGHLSTRGQTCSARSSESGSREGIETVSMLDSAPHRGEMDNAFLSSPKLTMDF